MSKLNETARQLIGEIKPGLVATADAHGKPNVSAKGTFRVLDDDTVMFVDVHSPRTVANLKENPLISVIFLDSDRRSCRIWGKADVLDQGAEFEATVQAMAAQNMKPDHVVIIKVEEVETSLP